MWKSRKAALLLRQGASVVLRTDIDEFVAVDPNLGTDLPGYLSALPPGACVAALGLDMIHATDEHALDPSLPILAQRRNAILTREFCKLVAIRQPVRWRGGFHRAQHVPIDIAPGLVLFHLALFDRAVADLRAASRREAGEGASHRTHISNRMLRFAEIAGTTALPYDDVADRARTQLMASLPSRTGPHLGRIADGNVDRGYHVRLPDRFCGLLPGAGPSA
jgi:hypothetical protein